MKTIYDWWYYGYQKGGGHINDRIGYSLSKKDYPSWTSIPKDVIVQKVRYTPCSATYEQYDFVRKHGPIYTDHHISDYIQRYKREKEMEQQAQLRQIIAHEASQIMAKEQPAVHYRPKAKDKEKNKSKNKEKGSESITREDIIGLILWAAYITVGVIVFISYALEEFGWLVGALYSFFWIYCLPIEYFFT